MSILTTSGMLGRTKEMNNKKKIIKNRLISDGKMLQSKGIYSQRRCAEINVTKNKFE